MIFKENKELVELGKRLGKKASFYVDSPEGFVSGFKDDDEEKNLRITMELVRKMRD